MRSLFIFILSISFLLACKTSTVSINNGTTAYEQKKFVLATDLLKKEIAAENDPTKKLDKIHLLADVYEQMNLPAEQVEVLQQALDLNPQVQAYFDLAMAQKKNEDYAAALSNLEEYKRLSQDEYYSRPHIEKCKEVLAVQNTITNLIAENLTKLNSSASDYAAVPYKNNSLVFSSSRSSSTGDLKHPWNGEKNPDIFISEKVKDNYSTAKEFNEIINTNSAEGGITFSKDFQTCYFTRCDNNEIGNSYCHIFMAEADGDLWYEPVLLSLFYDTVNVGQPHLSQDGKRLYFSSDAPFGFGGNDIYFLEKIGNEWSDPYNAGFYVNTEKDELFPTTDSKGNLYFSSNGRDGYGGLDIFKASPDKQSFSNTEILPYPINSGADDFSFAYLKEVPLSQSDKILEEAVFSSTRKGGQGSDDIYRYQKLFFNLYELNLSVVEKKFADPNNSESEVLGMQPLEEAIVLMKGQEKMTPKDGNLLFTLEAETDYKINVNKPGYFNKSINISTKGLNSRDSLLIRLYELVELEKIFPEKEIVIPNIYYDYDEATLRAESLPVLDKLVSFFEENKDLKIEIGSHTDSRGSDKYNEDLSQRRAQSVVDYFIAKGVPSTQLSAKGYGESKLVNDCVNGANCSEEKHQENRRTTFRVISAEGVLESQ